MNISFSKQQQLPERKPKTVEEKFLLNVHEGDEAATIRHAAAILTRATPEELAVLAKLFSNPALLKQAMTLAKTFC